MVKNDDEPMNNNNGINEKAFDDKENEMTNGLTVAFSRPCTITFRAPWPQLSLSIRHTPPRWASVACSRKHWPPASSSGSSIPVGVTFSLHPWGTTRRAVVHGLDYLLRDNILDIRGTLRCARCDKEYEASYDVRAELPKIRAIVEETRRGMLRRAPGEWLHPAPLACRLCRCEGAARPVIAGKKKEINWLFLLLGQLLGCCTLEQLKYFCKHALNHRPVGAKDRLLYLTYVGLCQQLDPCGPFDPFEL